MLINANERGEFMSALTCSIHQVSREIASQTSSYLWWFKNMDWGVLRTFRVTSFFNILIIIFYKLSKGHNHTEPDISVNLKNNFLLCVSKALKHCRQKKKQNIIIYQNKSRQPMQKNKMLSIHSPLHQGLYRPLLSCSSYFWW